jgi:hypothetical protein
MFGFTVRLDITVLPQDDSLSHRRTSELLAAIQVDGLRFTETISYVSWRRCHHLEDVLRARYPSCAPYDCKKRHLRHTAHLPCVATWVRFTQP